MSCNFGGLKMDDAEKREFLISALAPVRDALEVEKSKKQLFTEFEINPAKCPLCGHALSEKVSRSLRALRRVLCISCGRRFNAWTGTPMEGAHFSPAEYILIRLAVSVGLDIQGLAELTGKSRSFATAWTGKFRNSAHGGQEGTPSYEPTSNGGNPPPG